MTPPSTKLTPTLLLVLLLLPLNLLAIGIPLHKGPRCMVIQGQFDPIKLEIKFPEIPNKQPDEKFKLVLYDFVSDEVMFDVLLEDKTIYRKNLQLPYNKIYHLCLYVYTNRNSFDEAKQKMYAQYRANQNFDALIGTFQLPAQLAGQQNLQYIFNMSESINMLNKRTIENQAKQREMEDNIARSNLQKNQRISMLTIIQCVVIVISGIYQVMALRRFLIEKNMY